MMAWSTVAFNSSQIFQSLVYTKEYTNFLLHAVKAPWYTSASLSPSLFSKIQSMSNLIYSRGLYTNSKKMKHNQKKSEKDTRIIRLSLKQCFGFTSSAQLLDAPHESTISTNDVGRLPLTITPFLCTRLKILAPKHKLIQVNDYCYVHDSTR